MEGLAGFCYLRGAASALKTFLYSAIEGLKRKVDWVFL